MEKIVFVNACVRECSRTLELARHVLTTLDGKADEVKLSELELLPLDLERLQKREQAKRDGDFSDPAFDLAKQFAEADVVVIAAPYWDLTFPALLKIYFENIMVNGLTFVYGETGIPKGLCKAHRLIYVTTAGGPIVHNFGFEYTASLAENFYGINTVECVSAEGLDMFGANVEEIMNKAKSAF